MVGAWTKFAIWSSGAGTATSPRVMWPALEGESQKQEEQAMTDKKPDPIAVALDLLAMNVMRRIMRTFYKLSKSERAFLLAKLSEINEQMA